jgi:predicted RNase H-like nuclease
MTPVIGVDGCPAGWVAIVWAGSVELHLRSSFADVMELPGDIIAVDMPIGLPERNGRTGDREARAMLGERQSSLFAVPTRAAVMQHDYAAACRENLLRSDPPRKVSRQCFNLFPRIREIDAHMSTSLQLRVFESHPELAFWAMNGRSPLPLPKKVKGTVYAQGLELRRNLLSMAGFPIEGLKPWSGRRSEIGPDDILDACACAWVARRILENRHIRFPADPPVDAKGLRMEINA